MAEKASSDQRSPEEIIAAFDRERDKARELNRQHAEQVRASRINDRPVREHPKSR